LDAALRQIIREQDGTPIEGKLLGDGVMATFASAHQAIECALRCRARSNDSQLPLHLGIHAGDVIREANNVYGGAVNIASRIADTSVPGEILVSETVRGLARTSAPVEFGDRGEYVLKGIADKHRLYAVRMPGEPEPANAYETHRSAKRLGSHVILVTDLQKGSHIAERIEDPRAQALMWEHLTIVENALQAHGSAEVRSAGDGYMALFTSPASALESAIAIQRAFAERNKLAEEPLLVQIGLNAGEPVRVGRELHGAAVVLAWYSAREAEGGQILATEAVRQLLLGRGYSFTECGQTELRSSEEPVRLYELSWRDSIE
jgi:class 3 adenylate cyclase